MDQGTTLSPLATVVLTLLVEHPMHPYEATYHFRVRHVEDYVKVRTGSLYHTFEQLQRKGLIEPVEVERAGRRPERTVYRITDQGRAACAEAVARLVTDPVNEYTQFEAGLVTIAHLGRIETIRALRERALLLRARAAQHRTIRDEHLQQNLPRVFLLEIDFEVDRCITQAAWCDRTANALESGDIEWPDRLPEEVEEMARYHDVAPATLADQRNQSSRPGRPGRRVKGDPQPERDERLEPDERARTNERRNGVIG
jgi:DNA-binding PadR family transcriptional regulator